MAAVAMTIVGFAGGPLRVAADEPSSPSRPNILLIYTDDHSYKTLSCYADAFEFAHTPNIDALASQGVRFHRAYMGAWCMPSRASFLTGRLQHGVATMRMRGQYPGSTYDPKACRFWPSVLRGSGYHTAQIGKWHTGDDAGYGRDWDFQMVWNRPAHPENAGNYFYDQIVTVNGEDQQIDGYSTDNYTRWALDYIRGQTRPKNQPWYLWLCYSAVHGPTTPADRHRGKLSSISPVQPADMFGPWTDKPSFLERTSAWMPGEDGVARRRARNLPKSNFDSNDGGKRYDDWIAQYNECVLAIDEGVGQLVEALRETGQADHTLIVFTADQGFALGEHGLNQKIAAYDAAVASPLIVVWPGKVRGGGFCRHAVNAPDVVRMMCDAAQIEVPWKMHGRDIRPLIDDPDRDDWTSPMLMTHTARSYGEDTDVVPTDDALTVTGNVPWYAMLRDGKYKYVRTLEAGQPEELYDLDADPEELVNLARSPAMAAFVKQLRQKTIAELENTDAGFASRMPPVKMLPGEVLFGETESDKTLPGGSPAPSRSR